MFDRAAFGMQNSDRLVGHDQLAAQRLQRLEPAPAPEVMPEGRQAPDLRLRFGQKPALIVRSGACRTQALIRVGQPLAFLRLDIRLVLRRLARFLLARQVGSKPRELLMAGLPQGAKLKEHERAESG